MELFARCDREPERLLAVTEEGKRYTLGDLNAAAERIAGAVGEHRLVFVLCENTPGTLLGYLGCLKAGEVPLLLDAHCPGCCAAAGDLPPAFVRARRPPRRRRGGCWRALSRRWRWRTAFCSAAPAGRGRSSTRSWPSCSPPRAAPAAPSWCASAAGTWMPTPALSWSTWSWTRASGPSPTWP
ncbi:MAG: hypothetical protein ACLUES_12160 [Flavonifractor plautii]